ncbi:hypothetical protein EYF80_059159 [Liparis tanakae]|uniref:Uncharacterized protein n=1 Tax=Liparis tanakae TaxID=230148 RepID=A0A4Z2EQ00_9TELE|nr:hypothetical protein EYF80_059159 [Liparis tanakae]
MLGGGVAAKLGIGVEPLPAITSKSLRYLTSRLIKSAPSWLLGSAAHPGPCLLPSCPSWALPPAFLGPASYPSLPLAPPGPCFLGPCLLRPASCPF